MSRLPYSQSEVRAGTARAIDLPPLQSAQLLSLRQLGQCFWLDSNSDPSTSSGYHPSTSSGYHPLSLCSYASATPSEILEVYPERVRLLQKNRWREFRQDPFVALSSFVQRAVAEAAPSRRPRPVCVGYLSYELGAFSQRITLPTNPARPLLYMARYDSVYALERSSQRSFLLGGKPHQERLLAALQQYQTLPACPRLQAEIDLSQAQYQEKFDKIKEHILNGDIYQANLSIGLHTPFTGEPISLYDRLRSVARVPFGAYLEDGHGAVLSASMERFLRGEKTPDGYLLETRPIKGTRPRRDDASEDLLQKQALQASEKDHAEHVMIVDLERNDLGRVAVSGGVEVSELFSIHPHPTVYHMESSVRALTRPELGIAEIFRSMFPTGSITGAPKKRAMQIIAEIEGKPRGVYCGAIGYFDDRGGFDFSVGIRTAELRDGVLQYRAGGGLVADSDADLEWQECNWKAAAFVKALAGE